MASAKLQKFRVDVTMKLHQQNSFNNVLGKIEEETGVDRFFIVASIAGLFSLYLIFGHFAELMCNLVGFLYPAYISIKIIESSSKADVTQWLTYWIVLALFVVLEFWKEEIIRYCPIYWLVKCVFLLWLYLPITVITIDQPCSFFSADFLCFRWAPSRCTFKLFVLTKVLCLVFYIGYYICFILFFLKERKWQASEHTRGIFELLCTPASTSTSHLQYITTTITCNYTLLDLTYQYLYFKMSNILRVGVAPWFHLNPDCFPSSKTGCAAGVELDILEALADMAKLKIELVVTNLTGCGDVYPDQNGAMVSSGLVKLIQDGVIDITGNLCATNTRAVVSQNVYGISWPVWQYQEQYVIQTPKPPPMEFSPFSPFSWEVWLAFGMVSLFILFLSILLLFIYIPNSAGDRSLVKAVQIIDEKLVRVFYEYPLSGIWPVTLTLLLTVSIFYSTFIMSAIMHPFPVWKPFSTRGELVKELATCKYKYLSNSGSPKFSCSRECNTAFLDAVNHCGFSVVDATQTMSVIANQNEDASSKLVLANGAPFISLYLSDFLEERDRLWIFDSDASFLWSGYLWRKDFPYAAQFDRNIRVLSDYKWYALSRYVRPEGGQPRTSDYISEQASVIEKIAVYRLKGLFIFYACGVLTALIILIAEIRYDRFVILRRFRNMSTRKER